MTIRIVVKGGSGAGKSTLSRQIAARFDLPYVELDALWWHPSWTPARPDEFRRQVGARLDDVRGWVVDGNFGTQLGELVTGRATLIVWLDLPLATKLARLTRRTARRMFLREELWNGNRESLVNALIGTEALFPWAVRTHVRHRREWPSRFAGRPILRLTSPASVEAWLAQLTRAQLDGCTASPPPSSR